MMQGVNMNYRTVIGIIHDIVLWHFAVYKCELSYMCPGNDIKLHPHRVKLYRIWCVEAGLVLVKALT